MPASQLEARSNCTDLLDSRLRFSEQSSTGHPVLRAHAKVILVAGTHRAVRERKRAGQAGERLDPRHFAWERKLSLEVRLAERTRIARELHDTLLQRLCAVLLQFQTVWNLSLTRPTEAREILRHAIDQAAEAITEGRGVVQGLRTSPGNSDDLVAAIASLGEDLAAHPATSLRVGVEGSVQPLHPIVHDEIYRIAGEALRNAFRHAGAKQIEVELRYAERQFRLRIRDDGKGIDPSILTAEAPAGHFGLHGMRERAKLVRGELTVWTAPGSGTEIELNIPAAYAYAAATGPRRSWLAKLAGKTESTL